MEGKLELVDSKLMPAAVSFHNKSGKVIGKFIIEDEVLRFEGNADKSAKIFVDLVLSKVNKNK